jgi:hypothetical protein
MWIVVPHHLAANLRLRENPPRACQKGSQTKDSHREMGGGDRLR